MSGRSSPTYQIGSALVWLTWPQYDHIVLTRVCGQVAVGGPQHSVKGRPLRQTLDKQFMMVPSRTGFYKARDDNIYHHRTSHSISKHLDTSTSDRDDNIYHHRTSHSISKHLDTSTSDRDDNIYHHRTSHSISKHLDTSTSDRDDNIYHHRTSHSISKHLDTSTSARDDNIYHHRTSHSISKHLDTSTSDRDDNIYHHRDHLRHKQTPTQILDSSPGPDLREEISWPVLAHQFSTPRPD
ncbi:hypothetical protein RRG08_038312 [Elysia crispata]|uniref:Uncharacterized protein n=1 Tax=Elysia crispata TaxID=231223 RepID=A0AAE1APD6_9GAST|nr:hypothetical protein RRG08_038312 [Elysia crispata]